MSLRVDVGEDGGQHPGQHLPRHLALLVGQRLDVVVGAVRHLVAQHAGQLVVGPHQFQQPGVDIDLAARQREGIERLVFNDMEVPGEREHAVVAVLGRIMGVIDDQGQPLADAVHAVVQVLVLRPA